MSEPQSQSQPPSLSKLYTPPCILLELELESSAGSPLGLPELEETIDE